MNWSQATQVPEITKSTWQVDTHMALPQTKQIGFHSININERTIKKYVVRLFDFFPHQLSAIMCFTWIFGFIASLFNLSTHSRGRSSASPFFLQQARHRHVEDQAGNAHAQTCP